MFDSKSTNGHVDMHRNGFAAEPARFPGDAVRDARDVIRAKKAMLRRADRFLTDLSYFASDAKAGLADTLADHVVKQLGI